MVKTMYFKVLAGSHQQDGKTYKVGQIVPSEVNLVKLFRNKFQQAEKPAEVDDETNDVGTAPDLSSTLEDKGADNLNINVKDLVKKYGVNVTTQFPTAAKVKMLVFQKVNWFTPVDSFDGTVMCDRKLRVKEVEPFLKQYLDK
jgi:hypothetical protein